MQVVVLQCNCNEEHKFTSKLTNVRRISRSTHRARLFSSPLWGWSPS